MVYKENNYCGCGNYAGCSCGDSNYVGADFPMQKGSRGSKVRALQTALNTRYTLPDSLRIGSYTDLWGDKTQAIMQYLGHPSVIQSQSQYENILAGKNVDGSVNSYAIQANNANTGQNQAQPSQPSSWQDFGKNPNAVLGLFGNATSFLSNMQNNSLQRRQQQQQQQLLQQQQQRNFEFSLGQQNINQQQQRRLPQGIWVVVGVIGLLLIGFLIFKVAK